MRVSSARLHIETVLQTFFIFNFSLFSPNFRQLNCLLASFYAFKRIFCPSPSPSSQSAHDVQKVAQSRALVSQRLCEPENGACALADQKRAEAASLCESEREGAEPLDVSDFVVFRVFISEIQKISKIIRIILIFGIVSIFLILRIIKFIKVTRVV